MLDNSNCNDVKAITLTGRTELQQTAYNFKPLRQTLLNLLFSSSIIFLFLHLTCHIIPTVSSIS